jgi:dihydroflavonol-4-reductase
MILVTGATGHIGNVLIRQLLENGEKVRALIWKGEDTTPIQDLQVERIEGDVLDLESLDNAFKGIDTVYHLAGIISIMPGKNPFVWDVNVQGTRNVLSTARKEGIRRLVYTSSIHAIARAPHGTQINETLPFDAENPYGAYDRSKAEASLEVQKAYRDGLDAVIVCPTGVIGPYDFRRSEMGNVIMDAAQRKTTLYVDGAYDFVDVRDVADGLIRASESGRSGESYILSGQQISVRYLLETVREVTGYAFPKFKIPFNLAEITSHLTPIYYRWRKSKPKFTPYSLEVLQSNSNISHAKASQELGYSPRPLFVSITDTVRWFLENHHLLFPHKGIT